MECDIESVSRTDPSPTTRLLRLRCRISADITLPPPSLLGGQKEPTEIWIIPRSEQRIGRGRGDWTERYPAKSRCNFFKLIVGKKLRQGFIELERNIKIAVDDALFKLCLQEIVI